jgi:drug/metabolite transporter (DMT)-like permease
VQRHSDIRAGIAFRLAAVVAMAAMNALVKVAAQKGAPTFEIMFFRNFFAFIPILAYLGATRGFASLRTQRPMGHLVRATVGISGMFCGFAALGVLPLSQFTAITFAAPLFITALSAPILGEKVGMHRWAAVIIGFAGVLVMVHPDTAGVVGAGSFLALGQALGTAGAMLAIRQLGASEPGPTIVFYFTLAAVVVGAVGMPFGCVTPSPALLLTLVCCGLAGGVGQLLLTQAFSIAPAAVVAPFDYASLIVMGVIGYLFWNEIPSPTVLLGAVLVAASGLYILLRETRTRAA